jgi:hypothetical protein
VLKHLICIQYRYENLSKVVYSLNHDITMNLPGLPSLPALGTVAHDITALEETNDSAGLQLRMDTMVE